MTWAILQRWHRRIGITVAIIFVVLCISGILLNHTSELDLSHRYVSVDWLLDWYEIKPDKPPVGYQVDKSHITQMGDRLYFNDQEIADSVDQMHGAVSFPPYIVVGVDQRLLLLTYRLPQNNKRTWPPGVNLN